MSDLKTKKNDASVRDFIEALDDEGKKSGSLVLVDLMQTVTGEEPAMWGDNIIGFGSYHYKYESGREGDWMLTGFSPRKRAFSIYIMSGFPRHRALMDRLGKYRTGKSCLYVNKLDDIDLDVLGELVREVRALRIGDVWRRSIDSLTPAVRNACRKSSRTWAYAAPLCAVQPDKGLVFVEGVREKFLRRPERASIRDDDGGNRLHKIVCQLRRLLAQPMLESPEERLRRVSVALGKHDNQSLVGEIDQYVVLIPQRFAYEI